MVIFFWIFLIVSIGLWVCKRLLMIWDLSMLIVIFVLLFEWEFECDSMWFIVFLSVWMLLFRFDVIKFRSWLFKWICRLVLVFVVWSFVFKMFWWSLKLGVLILIIVFWFNFDMICFFIFFKCEGGILV